MNTQHKTLVLICLLAALTACTPEEALVNSYNDTWRLLASGPSGLYTVSMPDGIVHDLIWKPTSTEAPYPVRRILEFRDQLFLLRTTPEIVVLDRKSFAVVATIPLGAPATGIAFANATTAYVAVPDLHAVVIVDLTVYSVAGSIEMGAKPADITAVGNQICVVLPATNEAKIIDSRTNTVEATVTLPTSHPFLVGPDGQSGVFCVVMKGAGKDSGSTEPPTAPALSSIDVVARRITGTVLLTARESEGPSQSPMGLAINSSGFCYVPVQNGLLQIQTRTPKRAAAIQFEAYGGSWYDASRARILCVKMDGMAVDVFDEFAEKKIVSTTLPDSANCLVGLAP